MIARGAADGSITKLRRGVYADAGACDARRTAAMHGGAIACVSAARHVGLWVLDTDDITHVWLGGHGRSFAHDRCACVEHWDDGPSTPFAIPSVPRILRQILYCRGIEEFFVTLESALRQGVISPAGLAWLRTNSNHTARDAIAFARRDADSGLESLVRWRLRDSGLRLRSQAHVVSVGIVDFLIGDRLIVEVDGRANHDDASHRHRDLMRDANATMWGFVTLRFDYAMIVHDWQTVEQAIFAAVDRGLHLVP
ncbi:MAG: DUF559 domain-containing protein [Microbacterium sp.]